MVEIFGAFVPIFTGSALTVLILLSKELKRLKKVCEKCQIFFRSIYMLTLLEKYFKKKERWAHEPLVMILQKKKPNIFQIN